MRSRIGAALASLVGRIRGLGSRRGDRRFAGTRGTGERGEDLAVAALRRAGYRVVERNFRTPVGELDVVAEEGETLCFVEVKWRRGTAAGHPGEAITREKQRRIARAAEWYLARRGSPPRPCRFDVVAIIATQKEAAIIATQKEAAIIATQKEAAIVGTPEEAVAQSERERTAPPEHAPKVEIFRDAFRGPFPPRRRR